MIRIVIADDEQTIRDGLHRYITKSFPELTVDASFADGKDVIEYLKEHTTDIVITDVRMSVKSGIDVAEYIYHNKLDIKVIFLSAYQEFEYARQAIAYNVKYYLSKPVKLKELKESLCILIEQINTERRRVNEIEEKKQYLEELLLTVKRNFYTDILLGICTGEEDIHAHAKKFSLTDDYLENTQCALISINTKEHQNWHYGLDKLYTYVVNTLHDLSGISSIILITRDKEEMLFILEFCGYTQHDAFEQSLLNGLSYLSKTALTLFDMSFTYTLLFYGLSINSLSQYRKFVSDNCSDSSLLEEKYKDFLTKVLSADRQGALDIFTALLQYVKTMSLTDSVELLRQFFNKICDRLPTEFTIPEELLYADVLDRDALKAWGQQIAELILNFVASKTKIMEDATIIKAKAYIKEHLADEIGLEDVAGYVYLNPVYFSRFFKQSTGQTMTEYLTLQRMQLATTLLNSHKYKIYEISMLCGYKSSKYFARLFKQYTGLTPSEYSRQIQ